MFNPLPSRIVVMFALMAAVAGAVKAQSAVELERGFRQPPDSARPWVYWFWLNGNITREGITADLEAMRRVGIGGVLIMEVDQGAPVGPVDFMSDGWRELFKHVVAEAGRLGLEVNMNNDAGWNGSGGPWIKPEQAMQKVVWTETDVAGGQRIDADLSAPQPVAGFYRDICVLAFPTPGAFRIANINEKACYSGNGGGAPELGKPVPPEMIIPRIDVIDISQHMDSKGHLAWDAPGGKWTVMRIGHTCTGVQNAPAPASGRGLECDKLSKEGIEAQFEHMMARLITDVGSGAGKTLVATHIDSWENGTQNWTPRMREEFKARRGYDLLPYLAVMSGRVVGDLAISERFLWDLRETVNELVLENYTAHMRTLANARGLRLSIEAYGGPCDDLPYAGRCDEPMGEFWIGGAFVDYCKEMASAAHTYGHRIVGAETFTANDTERWQEHPGSIKSLGDIAFCNGINRFVFHRYAMQPWVQERHPGMTMGPWGLHYERTNTWWPWTAGWHQYLARCQFLLRQGRFVADLCYLRAETARRGYGLALPNSTPYDHDECSAEVVLTRMKVEDGRLVLPDGLSYRAMVLPESRMMTPALLARIVELVEAGATVIGPPPTNSPSLADYPQCDERIAELARRLWGDCDGKTVTEHRHGRGRVIWGLAPQKVLADGGVPPDFAGGAGLRYIHRHVDDADVYFVANTLPNQMRSVGAFRVTGKVPEFWWPESGRTVSAPAFDEHNGRTRVLLDLGPNESVFVVFRPRESKPDAVVAMSRDGRPVWSLDDAPARLRVISARYGVLDDPQRTRDRREKVQQLVDQGDTSFRVARLAEGDDPAYGIVKTAIIECEHDGRRWTAQATDPEMLHLAAGMASDRPAEPHLNARGLQLHAWQPGRYELKLASGESRTLDLAGLPAPREVTGEWTVRFPERAGAPAEIMLPRLMSLSAHEEPGVKYFSGVATYVKTIEIPQELLGEGRRLFLDLGDVQVMADVRLNGRPLSVEWRRPYRVNITREARAGANEIEIRVVNQWINRLIGDEQLPEDSQRNPDGTLKEWPQWLRDGLPSPTGRLTFTTWRLWKKHEPLPPSGLIGPVTLQPALVKPVQD